MPLHPVPTPQFPRDSPWAPGHSDPLFPPTPLIPHPPQCLIPPPTPTILDPRLPEDPLLLDGPQDPPWVVWAYKTGWNYNTLQFALRRALPQWIKDVLRLAPKQTTYDGYKVLVTQVDQHYWEDRSKNTAPRTSWNTSGNTNWQAGATNGIQSSIPANHANPTPRFPPGQGVPNTNRPPGQCPPTQLNAADLHDTPVPLDTNPNDHDDILDPTDNQEALCANRIQDNPWIDVLEETQEK
ncbi:hypothetical protein C0989_008288 [Termitomyces sp. Mn162]|nr:hypothetical protein C0989_008288 [Termitomyces sp. Mn162]